MKIAGRLLIAGLIVFALIYTYRKIQNEETQRRDSSAESSAEEILARRIRNLPPAPAEWRLVESSPDELDHPELPDIQPVLREMVSSAKDRIVFENYFLKTSWGKSARRLIDASSSGVRVFGVLHPNQMSDPPFLEELRSAGGQLVERDIAGLGGDPREGFIHAKFLTVDGRRGWIGSANFAAAGMKENREMGIYFEDAALAETLEMMASFDAGRISSCRAKPMTSAILFQGGPDALLVEDVPVCDDGVAVLAGIAEKKIEIMMYVFSHQFGKYDKLVRPLRQAVRRGVTVRLIHDARVISTIEGISATLRDLKQWGIEVRLADVSSLGKTPDGNYHAKAMQVDGRYVMAGSNNWTDAGSHENRETALLVHSEKMADQFSERFIRDWNAAGYVKPF